MHQISNCLRGLSCWTLIPWIHPTPTQVHFSLLLLMTPTFPEWNFSNTDPQVWPTGWTVQRCSSPWNSPSSWLWPWSEPYDLPPGLLFPSSSCSPFRHSKPSEEVHLKMVRIKCKSPLVISSPFPAGISFHLASHCFTMFPQEPRAHSSSVLLWWHALPTWTTLSHHHLCKVQSKTYSRHSGKLSRFLLAGSKFFSEVSKHSLSLSVSRTTWSPLHTAGTSGQFSFPLLGFTICIPSTCEAQGIQDVGVGCSEWMYNKYTFLRTKLRQNWHSPKLKFQFKILGRYIASTLLLPEKHTFLVCKGRKILLIFLADGYLLEQHMNVSHVNEAKTYAVPFLWYIHKFYWKKQP